MNGGVAWSSACLYAIIFYSKRIEAQLQEIEQKSEKKKSEVRPTRISYPALLNVTISWLRYRPSYRNARSRMGLVVLPHLPSRYCYPRE
jgi:hypothetical protein